MDASSIALNKSTFEERHRNIGYLRQLYFYFVIELLIALGWSVWCRQDKTLGDWVVRYWGIALTTAIIAIILIIVATFLPFARAPGVNFAIYGIFTICFAYTWGYLCAWDLRNEGWDFLFYWLCLLTAIAIAFFLHAWGTTGYMYTVSAIIFILGACLLIYFIFLCFSDISFIRLLISMVPILVYGFFLNYNIRKMVRGSLYEALKEDPVSGAVRIWMEGVFVVCRLVELIAGIFSKSSH